MNKEFIKNSKILFIYLFMIFILVGCNSKDNDLYSSTSDISNIVSEENNGNKYDINTLENWGDFDKISSLYAKLNRNLENPDYVIVKLTNVCVLRGGNSDVRNSRTDNIFVINKESLLESNHISQNGEIIQFSDNEKIKVTMKDDTTNRVLHGDFITVTGILDTTNKMIIDAEYEMITPAD